ncbi:uncharacterized protein IL334_003338 [Kwoniella shivajii]|uniref:Zn(2)-C6 fungal-type domain-containing protein n=1 Tax=Kwoniella shivajii TaxID=564305 RepID=A0ABZ1CXA8_9TREE|nr:hypothetical protein IL334_003338 [Kwoniella shivajii]
MNTPSDSVTSVHPRDEGESPEREEKRKIKRPRAKLTCLNCKRRKSKCDKCFPCSSCVSRGESKACHYEEGCKPGAEGVTDPGEYKAIQIRLERIEAALTALRSPPATSPSKASPIDTHPLPHTADQERAHSILITSRMGSNPGFPGSIQGKLPEGQEDHINPELVPGFWPSIVLNLTPERSTRWNREMQQIFEVLPSEQQMEYMLEYYFCEMQLLVGLHLSVDPAWLAQLVCLLWVTCHYLAQDEKRLNHESSIRLGFTRSGLLELALKLYDALEMALNCSSWLFKPQLRILQTLLIAIFLNMQGCHYTGRLYGPPPDWSCCLWFEIAAGMQDPSLPANRPIYSVQVVRRAFHDLLLFDTYTIVNSSESPRTLFPYSFPDESILTPAPLNYSEKALLSEGNPSSRSEKTSFVWTLHQSIISREWRKISFLLEHPQDISYAMVIERNQALRDAFTDFLAIQVDGNLTHSESNAFALTYSSYQQRFLRLHRPFFLRGYRDPQFALSKSTIISAAKQIAKTHRRVLRDSATDPIVRSAVFMFQHHITALPILLLNALHDTLSLAEMKQELIESSDVFLETFKSGFQMHIRVAAKGSAIASEMLLDDPPTNLDSIEGLLQNIHVKAKAKERLLLDSSSTSSKTSLSEPINGLSSTESSTMSIQPMNESTTSANANNDWWDLDWTQYLRDM